MSLTREDKIWLTKLAFLLLHGLADVIGSTFKSATAIRRASDILEFGKKDKSEYLD